VEGAIAAVGDAVKNHPITLEITPDLPWVKTDQALLLQTLTNVLHNAAVYSPEQAPIEVTVRHTGHTLRLCVRDHGCGLPPGEEARVFGKFYRAPGAPAGGTGLPGTGRRDYVLESSGGRRGV
jgi:two-component system sensor histidine kinase KdpD